MRNSYRMSGHIFEEQSKDVCVTSELNNTIKRKGFQKKYTRIYGSLQKSKHIFILEKLKAANVLSLSVN